MSNRPILPERDSAVEALARLRGRGKRRLARNMLQRSAHWRRLVLKAMVGGMAVVVATNLVLGKNTAAAAPGDGASFHTGTSSAA